MYDFCPHCGSTISGQQQTVGQALTCASCGKTIGVVKAAPRVMPSPTDQALQNETAAHCPACSQVVEVKISGGVKSFVPHFLAEQRKMCPQSGKPSAAPPAPVAPAKKPPAGKDLSAHYTRETIRVIACRKDGEPTIEALSLEYLDKSDRVRLQIGALRDILGISFQMHNYPHTLSRPHLTLWRSSAMVVVGKKHVQGGYESVPDTELMAVVDEVRDNKMLFFA